MRKIKLSLMRIEGMVFIIMALVLGGDYLV
jgi:hypothetical protein